MTFSVFMALLAVLMTLYVSPAAAGSGVAELMGILNGIHYPNYISWKALITKFWGTIFAVSAGLCIGKEGPLAHIGAISGVVCCYIPLNSFKKLQNENVKR